MHFKIGIIALLMLTGCGKWFGEDKPTPPVYKFQYTKNDRFTIESFKIISDNFDKFTMGKLQNNGFIQAINRSMALLELATARLEGKYEGAYTQQEIQFILTSGILDESQQVKVWIRRFVALINILLGDEQSKIQLSDVHEIFRRVVLIAPYIVAVSDFQQELSQLSDKNNEQIEKAWKIKKNIFSEIVKMSKVLFQNDRGKIQFPLVKQVILNQYRYLDAGIDTTYWDRFIEAGFFINHIIFGRSERSINPENIFEMFDVIDFTYTNIFDVYAVTSQKIWSTDEFSSILLSYHKVVYHFLDQFCINQARAIEAKDLNKLFKLLHLGTQSESELFTNALLDLKSILFQSPERSFSRPDIQKMRDFLKSSVEKVNEVSVSNASSNAPKDEEFMNKIAVLWSSPFHPKKAPSTSDVKLSIMLLNMIDYVLAIYDENHDQKLSLKTENEKELQALLKTIRRFVQGFYQMVGENAAIHSLNNMEDATIGNILITTTDHLLLNGNQNGELDRFEILEMVSFIFENDRLVSSHFWSPTFKDYRKENSLSIDQQAWLSHAGEEPEFRAYFPRMMAYFNDSKSLATYLKRFIHLYGLEGDTVSMADLKLIMGTLRAIEQLFLKYDLDGNNLLNGDEILALFDDLKPLIDKAYDFYDAKNTKGFTEIVSDWWNDKLSFGEGWRYFWSSDEEVQESIFFYIMTHGFFPDHYPKEPGQQEIQWSSRKDIMNIIRQAVSEFKNANSNGLGK